MKRFEKLLVSLLSSACMLTMAGCSVVTDDSEHKEDENKVIFTVTAGEGGTAEIVSGEKSTYYVGDEVTVKATANEHYKFGGWVNNLSENADEVISTLPTYTFKLANDAEIEAIFYVKTKLAIYAHVPSENGDLVWYYGAKEEDDYTWLNLGNVTREHWTFNGWYLDSGYTTALNETNLSTYLLGAPEKIDIYANLTHNTVNITFNFYVVNGAIEEVTDGSVVNPNEGPFYEGKTPELETPSKESTETYAYDWLGWYTDEGLTTAYVPAELNDDLTLYGKFRRRNITKHTVTWRVDGFEKEVDEGIIYGSHPSYDKETPTKEATAQYTYTFKGWKIEKTADDAIIDLETYEVEDAVTFEAVFEATVNSYTIKFVDYNGTELKSETLDYGSTPTAPSTPNHGGLKVDPRNALACYDDSKLYTFTGWDKEIEKVTSEATYTAQYTERELVNYSYTIKVVGEIENGLSWEGHALECHETVVPEHWITKGDQKYYATYYLDESCTTELTDENIRNAFSSNATQTFYAVLGVAKTKYTGSTEDIGSSNAAARVGLDDSIFSVTTSDKGTSINNIGLSKDGLKLYGGTAWYTNGNTLSLSITNGIIYKIKINSDYSSSKLEIKSGDNVINLDNGYYTINGQDLTIHNIGASTNATISSIEILYSVNA